MPLTPVHNRQLLKKYRGRTVLITGSRGYIGCALATALMDSPCRLVLLDRSSSTSRWPQPSRAKVRTLTGDISRRATWNTILNGVDCIFHLAARETFGDSYRVLPDFKTNTLSVIHLLEACRQNRLCPRIVFASSANLFGLTDTLPVNEDSRDNPPTLWSLHKLTSEHYLHLYAQEYGINAVSLRLANVYGPVPRRESQLRVVINRMIADALQNGVITLFGNRDCLRDYLYIDDAIDAFLRAGTTAGVFGEQRYFAVGSGEKTTIARIADRIVGEVRQQAGRTVRLEIDSKREMGTLQMRNFVADSRRFADVTGWNAQTALERGIYFTVKTLL